MVQRVTDPELLAQLERSNNERVTDPALLAQLNAPSQQPGIQSGALGSLIRGVSETGRGLGRLGLGVAQGASEIGYGLGDLETRAINKLLGTNLQAPKPDLYTPLGVRRTGAAKVGEFAGELAGGGALAGALAPFIGTAGGIGAASAASTPGELTERAKSGAIGFGLAKALPVAFKGAQYITRQASTKSQAKAIEKFADKVNQNTEKLYSKAYEGTEGIKPRVGGNTIQNITEIMGQPGSSEIKQSISNFSKNPSIKALHNIRKDIQGKIRKLELKSEKSGLGGRDSDLLFSLKNAEKNITNDLQSSFKSLSPDKYEDWLAAQTYYKNYKVPLRKYKSIRDLLSDEKTISKRLKTDLSKDEETAKFLREQLGLNRSAINFLKGPKVKSLLEANLIHNLFR